MIPRLALLGFMAAAAWAAGKTDKQLLVMGKKLFLKECAGCHGDAGAKPLEAGEPLNVRLLMVEFMRANIAGRLPPNATADLKKGVELYIRSFNKNVRDAPTPASPK
ncbi:MAG: hypothetical protein R2729_01330 [Bryobacteraceae bacterium]